MKIDINPQSITLTTSRVSFFFRESLIDKEVVICVITSPYNISLMKFEEKIKHMVTQIYFNETSCTAIYFKKSNYNKDEINNLSIEFIESLIHEKPQTQCTPAAYC